MRTKDFALRIIRLFTRMPSRPECQVVGKQLLRAGTSIGAHYREAARARSDNEFTSKLEVALMELDETSYWIELIIDANWIDAEKVAPLLAETNELISIFTSMVLKVKARRTGR